MLATLMPRNGLGSAIKRRNSKNYDTSKRRDSFSVFSSYSLPSSPDSLRRFSSYDTLLQALGSPQQQQEPPQKQLTLQPESRLKGRRGSISRLIRRTTSMSRRDSDESKTRRGHSVSCDPLDIELARIREQLAQMKTQDLDMSLRVDNLSNSVQALWGNKPLPPQQLTQSSSVCSLRAIRESRLETEVLREISESSDSEEDDQSFEDYIRSNLPLIGDRRISNTSSTTTTIASPVVPTCSVEIIIGCVDDDPKQHCLLNSSPYVITQKSQSYPIVTEQSNIGSQDFTKSEPLIATHQAHTITHVH